MNKKVILFLLILIFLFTWTTFGAKSKFAIDVQPYYEEDVILARNFVYEIKENIRKSSNMKLLTSGPRLCVKLNIMSQFAEQPENFIIYSATWTLIGENRYEYFINTTIGYCGKDVYESSAKSIVASTDQIISDIKTRLKNND